MSKHNHAERDKAATLNFFNEVFNKGNLALIDATLAPNYLFNGQLNTAAQLTAFCAGVRTSMPDINITVRNILSEDGMVGLHWQLTATRVAGPGLPRNKVTASGTNIIGWNEEGKATFCILNGSSTVTGTLTFTDSLIYQ